MQHFIDPSIATTPAMARVIEVSNQEVQRYGGDRSETIYAADVVYHLSKLGLRQKWKVNALHETPAHLIVTDDGMLYCNLMPGNHPCWAVHLGAPNRWKLTGVSLVFTRVGDETFSTRRSPFAVNFSEDIAVPYVGFATMFGGIRERKRFAQATAAFASR